MKRFLSHLVTQVGKAWNPLTNRPQRIPRLNLEGLEDRLVPSTTEIVYQGWYGLEFLGIYGDFGSGYNAAQPGDTIQLEPGAIIPAGTTISKQLTIQGDPVNSPNNYPVYGSLEVTPGGSDTIFNNLDFSQSLLFIDANTNGVGVEYSIVNQVNSQGSATWIYSNTIEGPLSFWSNGQGGSNSVSWNSFVGPGQVVMDSGWNDAVYDNTFQTSAWGNAAIVLGSEQQAWVGNNQIYNSGSPGNIGPGIVVVNEQGGQGTNVQIVNNQIQTENQGIGLLTDNEAGSGSMYVMAQGNNFGGNEIGVEVHGDGQNAGDINLGGENGNPGGNDFSNYQGGDGRLAIEVVNTNNYATVWAENNTWGTYASNVIKDAYNNSNLNPAGDYWGSLPGSGEVVWW
jgi:hypothetical protein